MRTTQRQKSKAVVKGVKNAAAAADPRPKFVGLLARALPDHGGHYMDFLNWLRHLAPLEASAFRGWLGTRTAPAAAFAALREDALALAGEAVREAAPPPSAPAQGCRAVAGERRAPNSERRSSKSGLTVEKVARHDWKPAGPPAPSLARVPAMFALVAAVAGPLKLSGKTIAVMAEQLAKPEVAREVFAQAAVLVALDTVNGEPRRGQP